MEPKDIVKHVHRFYRDHWKGTCGLTCRTFGALLRTDHGKPLHPVLAKVEYTRTTSKEWETPVRIAQVLRNQKTQSRIAEALRCPELFQSRNPGDIDKALNKVIERLPSLDSAVFASPGRSTSCLLISERIPDGGAALHRREKRAIEYLHGLVSNGQNCVVYWADPPTVGPSLIAYAMASRFIEEGEVGPVYLLRPFAGLTESSDWIESSTTGRPYEQGLEDLCRILGFAELRPSAPRILQELMRRKAILVVLNAAAVPAKSLTTTSIILELIEEGLQTDMKSGPATIVLVGSPQGQFSGRRATYAHEMRMLGKIENQATLDERSDFFELQWRRYRELRNDQLADDLGPRLNRFRQYFSADFDSATLPCNIRMLAFLASNCGTFSYFDPTAGWERLAGMPLEDLPIDIKLHLEEVTAQARNAPQGLHASSLQAIRWCSTALYWLTEDAVTELAKPASAPNALDRFNAAVQRIPNLVTLGAEQGSQSNVFKADLALRAVIQDQWASKEPLQRAQAHYRIARRLYEARDNKELLGLEFPLQPHWGRSRMHFLVETLRHLMRTCDRTARPNRIQSLKAMKIGGFPLPPTELWRGCDPHEVVNFCFGTIFWQELNGNGRTNVHNRKLSRQHGVYQLTGELLQLLSEGGELGKPHWALNKEHVIRYLREVAYAQLDFGDLPNAEGTFRSLIEHSVAAGGAGLETLDYQLDLVVVLTARDNLIAARSCLSEVASKVASLPGPAEGNHEAKRQRQNLRNRLEARTAQLLYLDGALYKALEVYERLQRMPQELIVRDVAHGYIGTLGAIGGPQKLQQAMAICISNLFTNSSRGLHHTALGFRVALGHLFRKHGMVDVAEATLDRVYHDVHQYGCSERTYLALLLESGRTVSMQPRREERAYAVYLRPCFDRAISRGYARTARTAQRHAIACLEQLLQIPESMRSTEHVVEALQGRGDDQSQVRLRARDSQHSFSPDLLGDWVGRLQTHDALKRELAELRDLAGIPAGGSMRYSVGRYVPIPSERPGPPRRL